MSANSRPAYGAVYPHRSDNPDRETALRIIGAGFIVSAVSVTSSGALEGLGKGTPSLLISLCRYVVIIIPTAFLLSRLFRSGWRLNAFDHRNDYSNHFYLCLPQGNSIKLAEPVNSKINVALCRHRKNHTAAIRCPPPDFMLLIVFSSTFTSTGFETWAFIPVAREC